MGLRQQKPTDESASASSPATQHPFVDAHFDGLNRTNNYMGVRMRIMLRLLTTGKLSLRKIVNTVYCYVSYFLRLKTAAKSPFLINFDFGMIATKLACFAEAHGAKFTIPIPPKKAGRQGQTSTGRLPIHYRSDRTLLAALRSLCKR